MSGIVGGSNTRGSGLIADLGTDGQILTSAGLGIRQVYEAAAAGGYTAEEDFWSFDMSTATGTTAHTITGSFTPQVAWFNYNPNAAIVGRVDGWMTPMTGADAFSGSVNNAGTAGAYSYGNTYPACGASGGYQYIWISSASAGAYVISNTKVSSPTGSGYFSLILFG
jgi:hypothetical protein